MKVPEFVPRVSPQVGATPGYQAHSVVPVQDATGAQMARFGEAAQQAGEGLSRAGDYLQDQIDDAVAQTAFNNYDEGARRIQMEFSAMTGGNAVEAHPKMLKALDDLRTKFESPLANANQQRRFASRADIRAAHARLSIDGHGAEQAKVYEVGALKTGASGSFRNYAIYYPQDPEKAALYKAAGIANIKKAAALQGLPPEMVEEELLKATTEMHMGVLSEMVNKNPTAAADYLKKNAGEMTLESQRVLQSRLEVVATKDLGWAQATDPSLAGLSPWQKIDVLNQRRTDGVLPADAHMQAVQHVLNAENMQRQAQEAKKAALMERADILLSQAPPGSDIESVASIEEYAAFRDNGLLDDIRVIQARGDVSSEAGYDALMTLDSKPEVLKGMSWEETLNIYGRNLSQKHQKVLRAIHAKAQTDWKSGRRSSTGNVAAAPEEHLLSEERWLIDMAKLAGAVPPDVFTDEEMRKRGTGGGFDYATYNTFVKYFETDINGAQAKTDKKLTRAEKEDMVRGYKAKGVDWKGRSTILPLVPRESQGEAAVTFFGQRVELREVADTTSYVPRFTDEALKAVQDYDSGMSNPRDKLGAYDEAGNLDVSRLDPYSVAQALAAAKAARQIEAKNVEVATEKQQMASKQADVSLAKWRTDETKELLRKFSGAPITLPTGQKTERRYYDLRRLMDYVTHGTPEEVALYQQNKEAWWRAVDDNEADKIPPTAFTVERENYKPPEDFRDVVKGTAIIGKIQDYADRYKRKPQPEPAATPDGTEAAQRKKNLTQLDQEVMDTVEKQLTFLEQYPDLLADYKTSKAYLRYKKLGGQK